MGATFRIDLTCANSCNSQVAHGYKELAAALNGTLHDVCLSDLGPAVTKIIQAIKIAAGAITLKIPPISASLRVSKNGQSIKRSLTAGFDYAPLKGAIHFVGAAAVKKGDTLRVSYQRWN